jgi:hypothetical protein
MKKGVAMKNCTPGENPAENSPSLLSNANLAFLVQTAANSLSEQLRQ